MEMRTHLFKVKYILQGNKNTHKPNKCRRPKQNKKLLTMSLS